MIEKLTKVPVVEFKNDCPDQPLVSVCIQTFNHEAFIEQCLDSILAQKTDFTFEILLGEDESEDRTREICISYANKYPSKIRLFLHSRNNVIYIKGSPSGRFNLLYNLSNSKGKYIAFCDGDDYWTDPYKLQKQVDFLEANPEYSICFHDVNIWSEKDKSFVSDDAALNRYNSIKEFPISINSLLELGNFMHTTSVIIRNHDIIYPPELQLSPVGDYFYYILICQHGFIHKIAENMAVYRRGVGIYSSLNSFEMQNKMIDYHLCILSYLQNEDQRILFLNKTMSLIQQQRKLSQQKELLLKHNKKSKGFKELLKTLLRKVKIKWHS